MNESMPLHDIVIPRYVCIALLHLYYFNIDIVIPRYVCIPLLHLYYFNIDIVIARYV